MKSNKPLAKSKQSAAKTLYAAFEILKKEGGQLPGSEVIKRISQKVSLTDWEKERYEKTGNIRWESILHFYTIDATKAGYLRKEDGEWILTPEGEAAMKKGPEEMLASATAAYRKWEAENKKTTEQEKEEELEEGEEITDQKTILSILEGAATKGIHNFVRAKNPYEFQDLVAALLRGMGYYTTFIAAKGKDGGVDIIAYQDPIGMKTPRIKVQVKHRPDDSVGSSDIQKLIGAINNNPGYVGLFVTSGTFSPDAKKTAQNSSTHIELIDFTRFFKMWQEFYVKMSDEDKNMLPLHPIYYLGANE